MRHILSIILALTSVIANAGLPGLRDTLANIIGDRHVAVAMISSRGDTITAGTDDFIDLASVMKFHQAAAISRIADFDTLVGKKITVTNEDLRRDTWSPMRAAATTVPFDISPVELLDYSLNMSDNNAADILFAHFASPEVVDSIVRRDYGATNFAIGVNEARMHADPALSRHNKSTALDAAALIYRFFTADTTASATLVKAVMARNSPFGRERIPAGMPNSAAKVFHKTGTGFTAPDSTVTPVNDLAFISYPTATGFACYSLAVFTGGLRVPEAESLIADISRAVYTAVIVNESLSMNAAASVWAGKKTSTDTGIYNDDNSYTWGDFITDAVFEIIDNALEHR